MRRDKVGGLCDDRVAVRERGCDLPRRDRDREVPRRDEADDAQRLARDFDVTPAHRRQLPPASAAPRQELEMLPARVARLPLRAASLLFARKEPPELVLARGSRCRRDRDVRALPGRRRRSIRQTCFAAAIARARCAVSAISNDVARSDGFRLSVVVAPAILAGDELRNCRGHRSLSV